jgi:glutamine amidotransferase-like uncharacterized protein
MIKNIGNQMNIVSGIHMDYAVSYLKAQLGTISGVLQCIESTNGMEVGYIKESLKRVESDIKKVRKVFEAA